MEGLRPGTATEHIWDPARQGTAQEFLHKRPVSCRIPVGSPATNSALFLEFCYSIRYFCLKLHRVFFIL